MNFYKWWDSLEQDFTTPEEAEFVSKTLGKRNRKKSSD